MSRPATATSENWRTIAAVGAKMTDALVKAGKSLEGLGDREGAVETCREILSRFEGTAAAAIASERLVAQNVR